MYIRPFAIASQLLNNLFYWVSLLSLFSFSFNLCNIYDLSSSSLNLSMCYVLSYTPNVYILKSFPTVPQNMTVINGICLVNLVKKELSWKKSLGWVLIQYYWCFYRWRWLGHRHTQREDHVRISGEHDYLRAKERGVRGLSTFQL